MNPRISLLTSSILLLGALYSLALSARAEDLLDIYKQAAQNDPQIRGARAQMEQVLETKPQARARFLPSVGLGANYSRSKSDITGLNSNDSYPSKGYNLSLTQPIYHGDAFAQSDQADALVNQAEAQFKAEELALALRVAERYFEVLAAQDNLAFAKAEHEAIGKQLEQTKQRFNVGLIAITDVHESQARFDLSTTQVIAADNRLASAWEALREVTGQSYKALATLTPDAPLVAPTPADIEQWAQSALKQNPAVQAARFAMESAEAEVSRQKAFHYPTLDAVGSYAKSDNSDAPFGQERTDKSIGLQLNWSLYQGGAVQSSVRKANLQVEQAKFFLEQQSRNAALQTRESYLGVTANISRVAALKQAVVSNKSALAATEAGYEVGTRTTVDVLNTRTGLFLAQRDYAQSRYDYILATLRLKGATGTLATEDLQQVNAWLKK
ncbi:MAG: TolC family outer membrane protein [Gammaproteobacteria bacterium]|nr:TolC family outer membrane protein [Gammaproteobacteria bacterium]